MTNPLLERKLSDAFTGLKVEESLNTKLKLKLGSISSRGPFCDDNDEDANINYELNIMGDLNNISESSGIVSGLTSSVNSSSTTSGATLPSPREADNNYVEDFGRDRRLKSAMVNF